MKKNKKQRFISDKISELREQGKNQQQSILTGTSKYKKLFCKKRNKNIYPALNFLCKTLYKSVFK